MVQAPMKLVWEQSKISTGGRKADLADDLLVMAGDNVLDFSLSKFVEFAKEKNTSCVMCHEENELKKQTENGNHHVGWQ